MTQREDLFIIIAAALRGHHAYQETGDKRYGWEVGIKTWLLCSLIVVSVVSAVLFTPVALLIWTDPEPFFWPIRIIAIAGIVGSFFSIRAFIRLNRKVDYRIAGSQMTPPPIPGTPVARTSGPGQITSGRY